ncbi:peptide chain release factor N(5)-glutamine methyltransferase [Rubrobacter tropicus]|uniref:Release factor glutamine methyltransferase n=1 Tax=Rubrobacter tropicus TaxID=2653851 RepID=A0A6G8Q9V5_9ACTN|nr:peptide chain release factor N(5)-glutamine methyltransferase [Rubrobacter tropicus]QIN83223.1 peptide chain release factor N(5)-glutamine methyltransferase [Rubrobacter tropicus]
MPTGLRARDASREAALELRRAGVPEPGASAEVLLSELLGVRRGEIPFHDPPLTDEQARLYAAWIERRANREPVQRILGRAYFRNLVLQLNEETLIPRPDTESVVDVALECLDGRGGAGAVLDVGTGTGAIAISIAQERPRTTVYATDLSAQALEAARRNADQNGASVSFHRADLFDGLEFLQDGVDLLVSNPPYVEAGGIEELAPEVREWDPGVALDGGPDGLLFYRRIFDEAPPLLRNGADVVLEVGDGQGKAVLELGGDAGFVPLGLREDLAGTPRVALLRWEG